MRIHGLMVVTCLMMAAMPALAAERGMIVINPDGTVTETDAPAAKAVNKPLPKAKPAKVPKTEKSSKRDPEAAHVAARAKVIAQEKKAPAAPGIKWNKPPHKAGKKTARAKIAPVPDEPAPRMAGTPISREQALRNAIAVAPPFKRSTVLSGNYKGRPVYEITIQTEDGEDRILIDAMTGDIVKPK